MLSVQTELIAMCSTLPTLDRLFHAMCSLLGRRLQELGVLSSRSTEDELSRVSKASSYMLGLFCLTCIAINTLYITNHVTAIPTVPLFVLQEANDYAICDVCIW